MRIYPLVILLNREEIGDLEKIAVEAKVSIPDFVRRAIALALALHKGAWTIDPIEARDDHTR
jgi:hypothetical protein